MLVNSAIDIYADMISVMYELWAAKERERETERERWHGRDDVCHDRRGSIIEKNDTHQCETDSDSHSHRHSHSKRCGSITCIGCGMRALCLASLYLAG